MKYHIFGIFFFIALQGSYAQNLLFKSGFESNVNYDTVSDGWKWRGILTGNDEGYDWETDLLTETPQSGFFTYLVRDTANLSDYIEEGLTTISGPTGGSTKALYTNVKNYDPTDFNNSVGGKVRSQYVIKDWDTTLNQAYAKYWVKLQDDLNTVMPPGSSRWRYLMEWRETGGGVGDYRWNFQIRTPNDPNLPMYWSFSTEFINGAGNFTLDWNERDTSVNVPIGEWFKLEVYWKHASDASGRIWIAVNDTVIIDNQGSNKRDSPIRDWHFFKVYVSDGCMDDGENYQWIDDVEIWDTIPDQVTGVLDRFDLSYDVKVFPNPSKSEFIVKWEHSNSNETFDILLFNSLGQIVYNGSNITTSSRTISTNHFESGIYYLQVRSSLNNLVGVKKIIIK